MHSKMKSMEIPVLATREPGGTDLGRGLRDILLFSEKDSIDIGAGGLYDTGMSDIINILNKDSENPPLLKQLTQYLNSLDKLRNTNWKQTFPEFI